MKHFALLLLLISFGAMSQETTKEPVYSLKQLDQRPEPVGGLPKFYEFIEANYKLASPELSGQIFLSFIVEKDGSLTNIKVLRDIGPGTGEEAVRVVKTSPNWTPGKKAGIAVRTSYSLPLRVGKKPPLTPQSDTPVGK